MASDPSNVTACSCCRLSRRSFLAGCASAGAGAFALEALPLRSALATERTKVRLVYAYVPSTSPIWPNIGYDFEARKTELTEKLRKACPEVEFLPVTASSGGEAKKVLEGDKEVDGYLVWILGIWSGAPKEIIASGRPTLLVDHLYGGSGEFLIEYAAARRAGRKVAGVSSSRIEDIAEAARCFSMLKQGAGVDAFVAACDERRRKATPASEPAGRPDPVKTRDIAECLRLVKGKKLLAVGGGWGMPESGKAAAEVLGIEVVPVAFPELHAAFETADPEEATGYAEAWTKRAAKVIEPSAEEIRRSGAMCAAIRKVMKDRGADAITINCLGGFYEGHLKAYPCLGFTELNDSGLVGGCEGDIKSALTMMVVGTLTDRPGYISDPVIDTSRNQIIYVHCVAPTRVFGPKAPANPFHIRSHSEDRKGAVVRSLMPTGYMTTSLEIDCGSRQILVHRAKAVENVDEDKACRSKLAAEVKGDMEKLLGEWDRWGWHRVTFYGDLQEPIGELAKALRLKVVEEA
jgi:hypothetical protein